MHLKALGLLSTRINLAHARPQQDRRNRSAWRGHFPPAFSKGWQRVHRCLYITVS